MAKSKKKGGRKRVSKRGKKKENITVQGLVSRYLLLLAVAFPGLWIFYKIFTPLTVWPVYWLLNLVYDMVSVSDIIIYINTFHIDLISACIAGSAYYLLLILNLTTPKIKPMTRFYAILSSFAVFLVINILRIFILSIMAYSGNSYFDAAHKFFWYSVSTLFVVGIWFAEVKVFRIKEIPFYSDLKFLFRMSNFRKK
jgi:exosortase/archaeosortase family protein